MNQFFSRVTVVILTIAFTYSFSTVAVAAEIVSLPDFPTLPEPGTEDDSYAQYTGDISTAVLRNKARLACDAAQRFYKGAMKVKDLNCFDDEYMEAYGNCFEGPTPEELYKQAYHRYMNAKKDCEHLVATLNSRLAAEQEANDSDELFDPTNPQTAQWAGTWNVRSKHNYGPAKGGSFPSQFTVEIFWHGCEVTWNVQEMYDCNVNGRTLTFWGFHNDDGKNRMDWTFFHSGLTLKGEFSGTIRGIDAGGTYSGKKAGY